MGDRKPFRKSKEDYQGISKNRNHRILSKGLMPKLLSDFRLLAIHEIALDVGNSEEIGRAPCL